MTLEQVCTWFRLWNHRRGLSWVLSLAKQQLCNLFVPDSCVWTTGSGQRGLISYCPKPSFQFLSSFHQDSVCSPLSPESWVMYCEKHMNPILATRNACAVCERERRPAFVCHFQFTSPRCVWAMRKLKQHFCAPVQTAANTGWCQGDWSLETLYQAGKRKLQGPVSLEAREEEKQEGVRIWARQSGMQPNLGMNNSSPPPSLNCHISPSLACVPHFFTTFLPSPSISHFSLHCTISRLIFLSAFPSLAPPARMSQDLLLL